MNSSMKTYIQPSIDTVRLERAIMQDPMLSGSSQEGDQNGNRAPRRLF